MPGGLGGTAWLELGCGAAPALGTAAAGAWATVAAVAVAWATAAWMVASVCCCGAANCCSALPMAAKASAIRFSEALKRCSMLASPSLMRWLRAPTT